MDDVRRDEVFELAVGNALAHHARDIVLLMRVNGDLVFANDAAVLAYGREREELIGLNIRDLRAPETRAWVAGQMSQAAMRGLLFETDHLRCDGEPFPVEVSSREVIIDGERYLLSIVRDITDRRKREAEREKLLSDLESANRQLEGLLTIVSSAVGRVDLDQLLREVLRSLCGVMNADSSLLMVTDEDRWKLEAEHGCPEIRGLVLPLHQGFSSHVADAGELRSVEDIRAADYHLPLHDELSIVAMLGVPLYLDSGALYGVLECTWSEPRHVSEAERMMLRIAADRVMAAVSGARRYEAERKIADMLQGALLNVDEEVPGVALGHLYRSATLATRVGGDFYDVFTVPNDKVAVLIGDISGKGLEAAVLTTLVKDTIRAFALAEPGPAVVLGKTNEILLAAAHLPEFASVSLYILDVVTGEVAYCCAGHPPAVLRRADGAVELQGCGSPLIGVLPDLRYTEETFVLGKDDVLVLYTDGVTEARDTAGGFFGDERLIAAVSDTRHLDVADIPHAIHDVVMEFTGGSLSDDMAIVALRRS